jgi:anti-sigma regulatory factor (Ser/Thr protein kinase)
VRIIDRASVSEARELVRACARAAGLDNVDVERMAAAVSELAQNQIDHARKGVVACHEIARGGVAGIEILAGDRGPGLVEPATAIAALLPGKGLGVGLAGVRRAVDEFDVDVRIGESTTLTVRRFAGVVSRHPEVAVMGRGLEDPSGDTAVVARDGDRLWLSVIDGGGHGVEARQAADLAAGVVSARAGDPDLAGVLGEVHRALHGTRGAACTIASWDVATGALTVCGVGNVAARLYETRGGGRAMAPAPGMLGARMQVEPRVHTVQTAPRSVLLLATDGIASRSDPVPALVGRNAVFLAEEVLRVCAKPHDDALVLVAR